MTQTSNSNANALVERIHASHPQSITGVLESRGELTLIVKKESLRAVAQFLRDDSECRFNLLSDATCVDRFPQEPRFELNYQLVSIPRKARLRLRTSTGGDQPAVDTLIPVWPGANWLEIEIFDLFGVKFEGHPELRRFLLPEGFEGYPLRRDFPTEGHR